MIVVVSYRKYPRSIVRVFIDFYSVQQLTKAFKLTQGLRGRSLIFILFTTVGKGL